jgi:predicted DNA-binding transcriptional regulator AlpA
MQDVQHRREVSASLSRERGFISGALAVVGRGAGMTMRNEIQLLLAAAKEIPASELPRLLGELEEIRVTALARLTTPAPAPQPDQLLDVEQAAVRLGVSADYLYRHSHEFPFTRRIGKRLLFSVLGIEKYLRHQNILTSKHLGA